MIRRPIPILAAALALIAAGCVSSGPRQATGTTVASQPVNGLAAAVASYDLAVGPASRFLVGLFDSEKGEVGLGTTALRFTFLGARGATGPGRPGPSMTATFLPIPGSPDTPGRTGPVLLKPSEGRGVYEAQVGFDQAGFWQVEVEAAIPGLGPQNATAAFEVADRHHVPAVGDPAPRSENLTLTTPGAQPSSIDSRASATDPVPDPDLHRTTLAAAIAAHRPIVAVFSTPTFCVSRFCGPVTDMVADLAAGYEDRATFVHVEIWKDFTANQLNDTAAEWLTAGGGDGNEPWVFVIGADGRIAARFDNVSNRAAIEPILQALPTIGPDQAP